MSAPARTGQPGRPKGSVQSPEERARRLAERQAAGADLRQLREAAGLSRAEVAAAAGVTPAAVGHWETGVYAAPPDAREAIAAARKARDAAREAAPEESTEP